MIATGTFTVSSFEPTDYVSPIEVGSPIGHAHLVKEFTGEMAGRATTQFSAAFDQETGVGTYVALEAFEGSLAGREGAFAFVHSATTDGTSDERLHELLVIAPGSGRDGLAGITGTGRMVIEDGVHRIELDYSL